MNRRPSNAVAVVLVLLGLVAGLVGCGGDDSSNEGAARTEEPGGEGDEGKDGGDDGEEPAEVTELEAERVADLNALAVYDLEAGGDGLVALVQGRSPEGYSTTQLATIAADGSVGTPVAVDDGTGGGSIQSLFSTPAGLFATGSTYNDDFTTTCGYRPVDPTTLALGALVATSTPDEDGCSTPSVVAGEGTERVFTQPRGFTVADTQTGAADIVDLLEAADPRSATGVESLGDHFFVEVSTPYSEDTPTEYELLKVDASTHEVADRIAVPGPVHRRGDDLVSSDLGEAADDGSYPDSTVHAIDLGTLELTEIDESEPYSTAGVCPDPFASMYGSDETYIWSPQLGEVPAVAGTDRATCAVAFRAELEPLGTDGSFGASPMAVLDGSLYVVRSVVDDQGIATETVLDRVDFEG